MTGCKCLQPFKMQGKYFSLNASILIKISALHLSLLTRPCILTWAKTTAFQA